MDDDETLTPEQFASSEGTTTPAEDFPETLDAQAFAKSDDKDAFPETIAPDAFDASPNTSTRMGAAARGAAEGAAPGIAGVGAGLATGAAIGTALAPGIGTTVGALAGGVAAGMGAGWLVQKGQDAILDMLGLRDNGGMFSREQHATDEAQHPYARFAGEMAPGAALLSPVGSLGQRAVGAGIGAVVGAGADYAQTGHVDPVKVAMSAGMGAAFPNANRLGRSVMMGEGGAEPPNQRGAPSVEGPDGSPGKPFNGEVLPPDTPELQYQNTGKYADKINASLKARDSFDPTDPAWKFWNDHVVELQSRADGKGGVDVDASLGPHSEDNPFTYQMSDRANDLTTVAAGVAHENAPAPQVEGAGNPVGAPMEGRVAQRSSGPLRDYRKLPSPAPPDAEPNPGNTKLSTSVVKDDIAAALGAREQPQAPQPEAAPQAEAPPVLKAPEPQPGVTDAVTLKPHEQRVIDHAMQMLREAGMKQVIDRIEALPPKDQAIAATKLVTAMQSKTGEATGGDITEARMPTKRPEVEGLKVQARDKADAARKQRVLDAHEAAYQKHVPGPKESKGQTLDRAREMVADTDMLAGNTTYKPRVRPASMQLIRQARDLLRNPNPANIEKFRQAEALLRGSKKDEMPQKTLDQETDALEGEIANKPQYEEGDAEIAAAKAAPDTATDRPEYEHFNNEKGEESAVYTRQHNDLTHWLNNLSDESHSALAKLHPDLETNLKTTQDPRELYNNLMDDLSDWQRKHLMAEFDAVPAENAPVVKRTRVATRDDLAETEPGAPASKGRVIDKSSDEFKKLAAQYGGAKPKEKPAFELENNGIDAARDTRTVDGTEKSLFDSMREFTMDEAGAVPLDRWARNVHDWLKTSAARGSFFHPRAPQPIMDYGTQIGFRNTKLRTDISRAKAEAFANARASVEDHLTPADKGRIYRAAERGELDQLPPALKDHWDKYWAPLLDKVGQAYDELRDLTLRNKFPGWDKLPERKNNGQGFMEWMPKRALRDLDVADDYDPITNRSSLSNWAPSTQERDWFAAQNIATGQRHVFRVNEDGKMVFYKNRVASRAKAPPGNLDPRDIGSEFMAGTNRLKIDHASIDELMQHGNTVDANGTVSPLKYSDNPGYVISDAFVGLKGALYRTKLLDAILGDPTFKDLSTYQEAKAKERWGAGNYAQTILPQLKGRYFPKPVAWAFDDLVKTGFNYGDNTAADKLSRIAQATLKPFYFLGPEVHVFNEADKYLIGNGLNHLNVPREAKSFVEAIKSVRTQDGTQAEIMDAGGNPMFLHALTSQVMPQIAKLVGEDLARRQWKYDPLMKAFGINSRDLASQLYRDSNKIMWWQSDVLYTSTYLQFRDKLAGGRTWLSIGKPERDAIAAKAVKETEHVIDSYVVPTTMGKSIGLEGTDAGRLIQKFLTDPLFSLFGRFHFGLYDFVAKMVKNMVGVNGMKGMANGAAQAAIMIGLYQYGYPLLGKAYSSITGNEHSEFEQRGATRFVGTGLDVIRGKKHAESALRNLWTPSTVVSAGLEQITNKDWMGKAIDDQPYNTVKGVVSNTSRRAERAAQTLISPYGTIARANEEPGSTPGHVAQKFIESNFGLKTPTPGAVRFEQTQPKRDNALLKAHRKRPSGLIERGGQWMTE